MDYKIAIPSLNRPELCKNTVSFLRKMNLKAEIYVFLKEMDERYHFDDEMTRIIIHNQTGIQLTRNYMHTFFQEGEKVVFVDDDFTGLLKKKQNKLEDFWDFLELIKIGFSECIKNATKIWGITNTNNPFFMNKAIQFGNYGLPGGFYGLIITKKVFLSENKFGMAEDQEICLRATSTFGGVVRFGTITRKEPNYGKIKGGIQDIYTSLQRKEVERKSHQLLAKMYPNLCEFKGDGIGIRYKKIKK